MKKNLDENEIIIIENAIALAENELKKIYQTEWLTSQITSIKSKLDSQMKYMEKNFR